MHITSIAVAAAGLFTSCSASPTLEARQLDETFGPFYVRKFNFDQQADTYSLVLSAKKYEYPAFKAVCSGTISSTDQAECSVTIKDGKPRDIVQVWTDLRITQDPKDASKEYPALNVELYWERRDQCEDYIGDYTGPLIGSGVEEKSFTIDQVYANFFC